MEQQTQATASPKPRLPRGSERCHARNRDRSQCRNHVQDLATGLCARHALRAHKVAATIDDSTNISLDLLDSQMGALDSTHAINIVLTNVVIMLAQGRISPRRASVITFALSLMLRSVVVMDRKAANTPPQILFDDPRTDSNSDEPAATAQPNTESGGDTHPNSSFDAAEKYACRRT
jgi:hypothetical protein